MKTKYLEELKKEGILVIPDYFNRSKCEMIISQIELFSKSKSAVKKRDEGVGGDIRIFKFEDYSKDALSFSQDKFLIDIVSKYSNQLLQTRYVLGGKVSFEKGAKTNSGGDWHRDGDVVQMKAMVYLSDVGDENGPFSFIKSSRNFDFIRRNNKYPFAQKMLFKLKGLPTKPPRYNNKFIMNQSGITEKIYKVYGKAGTLIIFDGSYIHRGDVIKLDSRYSLTNYYYSPNKEGLTYLIKNTIKKIFKF